MKLNELSGELIHSPEGEEIREALKKVYGGELEAVILNAKERGPGCWDLPVGGSSAC
jgi:hypothetical protein